MSGFESELGMLFAHQWVGGFFLGLVIFGLAEGLSRSLIGPSGRFSKSMGYTHD